MAAFSIQLATTTAGSPSTHTMSTIQVHNWKGIVSVKQARAGYARGNTVAIERRQRYRLKLNTGNREVRPLCNQCSVRIRTQTDMQRVPQPPSASWSHKESMTNAPLTAPIMQVTNYHLTLPFKRTC